MNQMHKEIDYEVNAGLEQLSRGLENTKNLASEMNREIDDQNEIITDITSTTNLVSNRIEKQNDSLQNVLKKHSTCGLWIMVVLVFIAIIREALEFSRSSAKRRNDGEILSDNKNILSEKRNLQRFKNERISNLEKKRSCLLNGHVHKPYTTIRRGCNSCICFFGRFVCSKRQCSIKTKSTKRLIGNSFCRYQRRKIQIGVRFITSNGCRSCGCQRNRQISCYSTNIGSCKLWNKKPLERFSCQFGQHTISDGKYFAIDSCGNRCGCESSQLTCTSIVCEKEPKYKKIRVVRAKCPNNGPQLILREEDYYRYKTIMDDSCNSCQCVQKNDNCLSQIVGVDECENIYSTSSYVLQCTRLNCAERSCLVMGKLVLSGSTCSFPSNGHDSYKCYDGMILC